MELRKYSMNKLKKKSAKLEKRKETRKKIEELMKPRLKLKLSSNSNSSLTIGKPKLKLTPRLMLTATINSK